jgi:hypothetical protein
MGVLALQTDAEVVRLIQVAGHIVADADVDRDRWLQPEVGIKAGDRVYVAHVNAAAASDKFDLAHRDEAVCVLHPAKVFEDPRRVR